MLSLGKLCEVHGYSYERTNGRKPHLVKNGKRIQCNTENYVPIVVPGLSTTSSPSSSSTPTPPTSSTQNIEGSIPDPASIRSESEDRRARGDPLHRPGEFPKFDENMDQEPSRRNPLHSDIPDWLQEFTENLVDERVLEHRDSHSSSSHESSLEPPRKVASGKHSVCTHFPKDRNCEICQRTKITRAPCRRHTGEVVPRAENCW